ncbi:MAG: TonB-dependent receptor, partial [Bacteroidales bacterium]|nr:TonB-dependent receptor [Bacteroidales bacterium]
MILSAIMVLVLLEGADTTLSPAVVVSIKDPLEAGASLPGRTAVHLREIESEGMEKPADLSGVIPNLHIPDYGSSMTSTIYLRGFGSRMENPVMGLYVDDIPVLDKNAYDFDMLDIRKAEVLRGPQGTLFGRNSMIGVMSVETLSPQSFQGWRGAVEYGSANSLSVRTSVYSGSYCLAAAYRHSDGFYTNEYTGKNCDPSDAAVLRFRFGRRLSDRLWLGNILSASWTMQGGYPYRQAAGEEIYPVRYNDVSGYRRLYAADGLKLLITAGSVSLKSVTSLQFLADRMDMDQDFTAESMFTLRQIQRQCAVSEELTLEPAVQNERWRRRSGIFAFVKGNDMDAPVTFKQDGIDRLILDNANANIPEYLGTLGLDEREFVIGSNFDILACNLAAYHESVFLSGDWQLTAGIRADLELDRMDYASDALIHFRLVPAMAESYPCETEYSGRLRKPSFQVLPKLTLLRDFRRGGLSGRIAASWAEGYRAGGFNTQIFSDILQNRMMGRMMDLCGVHIDGRGDVTAENTVYEPEFSDNFELGGILAYTGGDVRIAGSADVFYILGRNQQITVFPEGMSTGRMMRNAGKSRSAGAETTVSLYVKRFRMDASYGYTDARFTRYFDGNKDRSGKRVPYSPAHTLSVRCGADAGRWSFFAHLRGLGDIYWDEDNTLRQPFRLTVSGGISYSAGSFRVYLRGENLSGAEIPV